ncbi:MULTISPECIES: hypothetical protein [unclassified Leclercia]|uniref:Uncharacterized protein n=1 Tax=Leclercia barmai TaxID=2785629 RepID=A0ABS7RVM6_9ENTR|nr:MULTISPECIES: hypothetical protein [unclassified Leclercia]MBZ0057454.1 hypothetical protein [Leclercia sp. EMC7]MCM5695618.1 hypothetical protein [Leclercia sp. LTM01]MCM5700026.1 hypothetical protein [Leclercia sp. LTM14]
MMTIRPYFDEDGSFKYDIDNVPYNELKETIFYQPQIFIDAMKDAFRAVDYELHALDYNATKALDLVRDEIIKDLAEMLNNTTIASVIIPESISLH